MVNPNLHCHINANRQSRWPSIAEVMHHNAEGLPPPALAELTGLLSCCWFCLKETTNSYTTKLVPQLNIPSHHLVRGPRPVETCLLANGRSWTLSMFHFRPPSA